MHSATHVFEVTCVGPRNLTDERVQCTHAEKNEQRPLHTHLGPVDNARLWGEERGYAHTVRLHTAQRWAVEPLHTNHSIELGILRLR